MCAVTIIRTATKNAERSGPGLNIGKASRGKLIDLGAFNDLGIPVPVKVPDEAGP